MTLQLHQFKKEHIPQYIQFAIASYSSNNPYYSKGTKTAQYFYMSTSILANLFIQASERVNQRMKTKILYNSFVKIDNKIAAVSLACDIHQFINVVLPQINIEEIKFEHFAQFPIQYLSKIQQGKATLGIRAAVRKQFMKQGIYQKHLRMRFAHLSQNGVQYSYGWSANRVIIKVLSKLQNKIISEYTSHQQPVYFMQLNLKNHKLKPSL